jgi:dTDP-4-amino-4,6-dideoxygalactose transaminase
MSSPHQVTHDFEQVIAFYTGAPYCVAVNSCTMALLLACAWWVRERRAAAIARDQHADLRLEVPKRTYVGVPMSVKHAGARVEFVEKEWQGAYQIEPSPVWDSARWLTHDLYRTLDRVTRGTEQHALVCLSFHATKTLGIEQGGAILCHDADTAAWLRRARFDGRTQGASVADDDITEMGWHCYMNPSTAAQGLMRMAGLPKYNAPLPNDAYPDLSLKRCFHDR